MSHRLRILLAVLATTIVAIPAILGAASPANAAFGDETFGCRVAPGTDFTWKRLCLNTVPASSYHAGFALLNTSGSYTFSWTITGTYDSIHSGCTSTSAGCSVVVPGGSQDSLVTVSVTYSQNGQSMTKHATAMVRAYCGGALC